MTYFSDLHFFVGLQKSMKTKVYIKGLYNLFINIGEVYIRPPQHRRFPEVYIHPPQHR